MSSDPTYTIAVCNYNMEETVRESLESMLGQITDDYEVVVIDDSTDSSPEILTSLADEWANLRVFTNCGNTSIAEARNESFERAAGEYILFAMDTDDKYTHVIQDFVTIYHKLEDAVGKPFFLSGQNLNMAPRSLLLDVRYRDNLGYGEDRDLWRRLMARDAYIGMKHRPVVEQIGYDRPLRGKLRVGYDTITVQFQSGMRFLPYIRWATAELVSGRGRPRHRALAHVVLALPAYVTARRAQHQYSTPEPYDDMSVWKEALRSHTMTLPEIEAEYGFTVERSKLSDTGRDVFDVQGAAFEL